MSQPNHNITAAPLSESQSTSAMQRLADWQQALKNCQEADIVIELESSQLESAFKVLCVSDYIYGWALKQPHWLLDALELRADDFEGQLQSELDRIEQKCSQDLSEYEVKKELRLFRHRWSVIIATFDLLNKSAIQTITEAQSRVANQLIQNAYAYLYQRLSKQYGQPQSKAGQTQHLYILAMGKLGGMELNFSSDIDLIFCYPEEGQTNRSEKPLENLTFFTRLGQRLVVLLSEKTTEGFVYRVDMRLRPYGQSGDLVLSFDRMEDYYLEQGREWERFAMIKAAILPPLQVACSQGTQSDVERLTKILKPFSFRRYIDFGVLDSIRKLKQKISSEVVNKNLRNDIKLGEGGIRELEFIVQSYQLISGGRNPELQVKGWWQTLLLLQKYKLVDGESGRVLLEAYNFLRRLENILQIRQEKQTQQLPHDGQEQSLLAYGMGYLQWNDLQKDIQKHRKVVEEYFNNLFKDPEKETQKNDEVSQALELINSFYNSSNSEATETDKNIELIANFKQQYVENKLGERGQKRMLLLLPHLLIQARKSSNSSQAIERTLEVLQGIGRRSAYFEMLAENLPLLEQLIKLVSHSSWLSKQLSVYPSLLDELLFPSSFGEQLSKQTFSNLLQQNMLRIEPTQREEQLVALANFKQTGLFKVAIGDLNQGFNIQQVSQQLTDIAEVILECTLHLAWADLYQKHGGPKGSSQEVISGFQIIGYGKLGGDELAYASDLDLVFLYEGNPQSLTDGDKPLELQQFYTRLAQRLVNYLSARTQQGIMYEVDTRLRPSGRSGLLVSHIDSFEKYQQSEAWTWEHQALVRARPILGISSHDKKPAQSSLAERYQEVRSKVLSAQHGNSELQKNIVDMRNKMRANLDKSDEQHWNIKQGKGGLVDIEFLVQYWALTFSAQLKSLGVKSLPYNNIDWLKLLSHHQCVQETEAQCLLQHYRLFRQLSNFKALQVESADTKSSEFAEERAQVVAIWEKHLESKA